MEEALYGLGELPSELVAVVLGFGDPLDRLLFSLTCRAYRARYPFGSDLATEERLLSAAEGEHEAGERPALYATLKGKGLAAHCARLGYLGPLVAPLLFHSQC